MTTYPPEDHMLRDLGFVSEPLEDGSLRAWAPIHPHVCDASGRVRVGVIATMMDVVGASCVMASIYPDRSATEELAYQCAALGREGPLIGSGRILREGSRQAVVGVDLWDGHGSEDPEQAERLGAGTLLFHRLPQRADHSPVADLRQRQRRRSMGASARPLDEPYLERAGLRVIDAPTGRVEIDNHHYVRNSFGSLNGGMVATLIEVAGELAARGATGEPLLAADLSVQFLAQSSPGPIRSRVDVIRRRPDHAVCRVALLDGGADDRLLSLGTLTAARFD